MRPAHARTGVAAAAAAALLLCSCSSSSPPREDEAHAPIRPRPGFAPDRLTVHQPVLGDVHGGAAYARRLSGRGVRIGIDDDYVDFTQRAEFGNRVERDPARGARIADKGSTTDNDIRARRNACLDDDACRERAEKNTRVIAEGRLRGNRRVQITFGSDPEEEDESPGATMDGTTGGILEEGPGAEEEGAQTTWVHVEYDSRGQRNYEQGVIEEIVGLEWVREQLRLAQDVAWILLEDRHDAEGDELSEMKRWGVIPNVEQAGEQGMIGQYHGTMVASAAAGWRYGIAPNAQIVPTTRTLEGYDWVGPGVTPQELRIQVRQGRFSQAKIEAFDARLAREQTEVYQYADIINRSWGDLRTAEAIVDEEVGTQVQFYRRHFPKLYRAFVQADTHPDDRTIVVTAAGNAGRYGRDRPSAQAQMPYHMPELRGHTLAVAASDPENGALARYSNPCGPLPSDWVASRDGRHYCLTAPGTVNALVPVAGSPGEGTTRRMRGTSFAAPLVSGGLALMMEQFRGTMGNTAIAQRMLDTANRRGRYADSHLYGAGMMDLRRALAPVGALSAGQSRSPASTTTLVTPAAFGDVTGGLAGVEIAVFDEMEFPFWQPISEMITRQAAAQDAIPEIEAPAHDIGIDALGLDWREAGPGGGPWVAGFAEGSASVARLAAGDGLGYGASVSAEEWFGTRPSGGFGHDVESGMVWISRSYAREVWRRMRFESEATLAASGAEYENDAIFEAGPALLSAFSVGVRRDGTALSLEQPLRAESGTGRLHLETGWIEDGRRLVRTHEVGLEPEAREMRVRLRHQREALGGQLAIEARTVFNAGHVDGEVGRSVGIAYRVSF